MEIVRFLGFLIEIINRAIVPLIFAVAFLMFLWGMLQFFFIHGGNEEKRKEGRSFILYGIIGFFVMMSVWGLVNILTGTFGFQYQSPPPLPSFDAATGSTGNGYRGGGAYDVGGRPGTPVLGRNGQATIAPAQPCGILGMDITGSICLPTNECIGGVCRSRSLDGGAGEPCLNGTCVNGYICNASNTCVRNTRN